MKFRLSIWLFRYTKFLPDWSSLLRISDSGWFRVSPFWIIVIPIAAKSLERIADQIAIPLSSNQIDIQLGLPFSWHIFYFAWLSILSGGLIVEFACPTIIKKYKSYDEYSKKAESFYELCNIFSMTLSRMSAQRQTNCMENIVELFFEKRVSIKQCDEILRQGAEQELANILYSNNMEGRNAADFFSYTMALNQRLFPALRFLCILLYFLGFLFLTWVSSENVLYVTKALLRHFF